MKTEIVLIRHGETEANRLNVFRGRLDVRLNENGRRQAEEIGEALKGRNISKIYSSPLTRAVETGEAVSKKLGLELIIDEGFNNINLGLWQGVPKEKVQEIYPELWGQWVHDTENIKVPEGETLLEVRERSFKALQKLIEENKGKTFALVSHRCVLKVLITRVMDIKDKYFWKIFLDNASFSIIEYREDRGFTLTLLNESCHLSQKVYEEF